MVGIARCETAQLPGLQELVFIGFQVQSDSRTTIGVLLARQRILTGSRRFPAYAFTILGPGLARDQSHLVRDDEGRIETDPELTDQVGIAFLLGRHGLKEFTRTGTGNGADIGDDFIVVHADAVVADRDRVRILVDADVDVQLTIARQ